jgi:hypothetical protein
MGFCFPFTSDLKVLLEEQRAKRDAMHRKGLICPSVSTYDSRPFKRYKRAWKTACLKAGSPGKIPHDFKRTAVRNLVRVGVREKVTTLDLNLCAREPSRFR